MNTRIPMVDEIHGCKYLQDCITEDHSVAVSQTKIENI